MLLASEALNIPDNIPDQSTQGCEMILINADPIATTLYLSKDLYYEVIYAAPSANPTAIITGPNIVLVHRLPSLATNPFIRSCGRQKHQAIQQKDMSFYYLEDFIIYNT